MIYIHMRISLPSLSSLMHKYSQRDVLFIVELDLLVHPKVMQPFSLGIPPSFFAI